MAFAKNLQHVTICCPEWNRQVFMIKEQESHKSIQQINSFPLHVISSYERCEKTNSNFVILAFLSMRKKVIWHNFQFLTEAEKNRNFSFLEAGVWSQSCQPCCILASVFPPVRLSVCRSGLFVYKNVEQQQFVVRKS